MRWNKKKERAMFIRMILLYLNVNNETCRRIWMVARGVTTVAKQALNNGSDGATGKYTMVALVSKTTTSFI